MSARFEELDWRPTALGELVLRRRRDPASGADVYEVKLGDEFLMSSLFTAAEIEMAQLALAELTGSDSTGSDFDVVVGGLGLGYTAQSVLEHPAVRSLTVVEALGEVVDWHQRGLVPVGSRLTSDPRCELVQGDFFAKLETSSRLGPSTPARVHAVIVDIDHSPSHVLHPSHAAFYEPAGLQRVAERLLPGGVFALWSNDPPDESFTEQLSEVFAEVKAEIVLFDNPIQERESANTVYLAKVLPAR